MQVRRYPMEIREFQQWLQLWDQARGWDRVSPSHTLIHAVEEMGEVARLMLQIEGYKESESAEVLHSQLEEELSDLLTLLFKLANQTGVDVETALTRGQAKVDSRHADLDTASAEMERYRARQAEQARAPDRTE